MRSLSAVLLVGMLWVAGAQVGAQGERVEVGRLLPSLKGELLTGARAELPAAASGRVALLVFGFTYDSRFEVEAWTKKFREALASESRLTFFEIPMLGGMARLGRWFIDSGMRRGTPKEFHGNVLTVYGDVGTWKTRMGFTETRKNAAYLILLGGDGIVRWLHTGPVDDGVFNALQSRVAELLAAPG